MNRFARFVALPLVIAVATAVFGTWLPIIGYEMRHSDGFQPHNVVWEVIYGIGFFVAAWTSYFLNFSYHSRAVGWIGMVIWPMMVMAVVFLASRRILRGSPRTRLAWTVGFLVSLFVCVVGQRAENFLADRFYLPLFWNFYASYF